MTEEIVRIAARGDGVTSSGRHVPFGVPGDAVLDDGALVFGPHHQEPPCRHFPECGGCQLQHVDDEAYRAYLVSRVAGALAQHGIETPIRAPYLSPPNSRRRAALKALRVGDSVMLGFNAEMSHRIINMRECYVIRPELFELVDPLRDLLTNMLHPKRVAEVQLSLVDFGPDVLIKGIPAGRLSEIELLTSFAMDHGLARLSMGQRERDIWLGVPPVKLLWTFNSNLPEFCRQTATVERKDRVINSLMDVAKVTYDDVLSAAGRVSGEVERTPLIESDVDGARIWLKCECLQTGGAFKLRGATNRLLQLSQGDRQRGVVAFSSGNHARGVAIAARRIGVRAIIVMPSDAPQLKVDGTRSEGAEIIFYDRRTESREEIAARIASETGATVVPSFDDPAIVAGQGTAGLEIVEQLGRSPSRIVIPCGGGGLAAGIALAVPDAEIVVVEPAGWDDMARSLDRGEIVPVAADAPSTFCDAIMCSTFKLALAGFVLRLTDQGRLSLGEKLKFGAADPLENSPIVAANLKRGALSIETLTAAAVRQSDNSAANLLLRRAGGPAALTRFIRACGDRSTHLDRFELALNSNVVGDPRDTTTPAAMAGLTRALLLGRIIAEPARSKLTEWLVTSVAKPDRLKAGFPSGWRVGHKPGTGRGGALNDVAIVWPPGKAPIVVSAYISGGTASADARAAVHRSIARLVASRFA